MTAKGPLSGLRVLEFAGIGPGPHCAMLLSDLGADVVRIDREGGNGWPNPVMDRGRASIVLDPRTTEGRDDCLKIAAIADVLIEGFRPGVMERLGLGPDELLARNPRLVYGRITGWGQDGPYAQTAGHDINYIGLTGALSAMGKPGDTPAPPLNLVGDFGGGSFLLAFGIMAALYERNRSGRGQLVDAAIVDGVASMMGMFTGLLPSGQISVDRSDNLLGGAAPFYRVYTCACGGEIAVGALEPKFFAEFARRLGAPADFLVKQYDKSSWPEMESFIRQRFAGQDQAHWISVFSGSDACVTPVVALNNVLVDPHIAARNTYTEAAGVVSPSPVPKFSRTPGHAQVARNGRDVVDTWLDSN